MKAGIVGLPNVGKSTLFNALTSSKAAQSANYPFCTIEPNEGIVSVPDDRLRRISQYIVPKKLVPAALKLVDIAGIVKGASEGQGLGNMFLSHIREVDAILQVVRCFEDPDVVHVAGAVDPVSDIETIEIELMLADIQTLENALPKAERTAKGGDKEAKLRVDAIRKSLDHLAKDEPLRKLTLDEAEAEAIASFGLMTAKPVLYVANVDETDLEGKGPLVRQGPRVRRRRWARGRPGLRQARSRDRRAGRGRPRRDARVVRPGRAGPDGPGPRGVSGPRALLVLHGRRDGGPRLDHPDRRHRPAGRRGDPLRLREGFHPGRGLHPRRPGDLQGEKDIRAAGKLRIEGKEYVMQDGDICHFRIGK